MRARIVRAARCVKPQPRLPHLRFFSIAFDLHGIPGYGTPSPSAEKNGDPVADIASKDEIDGKSGVLDTYVDAVGFDYQPHDPEFGAACRHTREFEAQDDAAFGQRVQIDSFAQPPQQEGRIE